MTEITPQPGIMEIELYVGGKASIAGRDDVLKLSSNENPLGAPQAALDPASSFHRVEVFAPVATLLPYDGTVAAAARTRPGRCGLFRLWLAG